MSTFGDLSVKAFISNTKVISFSTTAEVVDKDYCCVFAFLYDM